jgi:antirestriction protein ArdC
MKMASLYETVTQRIIKELEAGAPPWIKPWKDGKTTGIMPQNAATGRPYSGVNILLLWAAREANGWPTPGFMTFQQAIELKACVRKGEKGTPVIFTKRLTVREDDEDKQVQMARTYYVFNEAQIDGLAPKPAENGQVQEQPDRIPSKVDSFIHSPGIPIRYGGNKACYVPSKDFIALPEESAFRTIEHHHATALHELIHASGHEKRLNRDLKNRFGTEAYAAEELIAELGSAFLCAHLGIEGELRHSGYIEHWLKLLRSDDRAIFTAASKASQAADYLRAFTDLVQEEAA